MIRDMSILNLDLSNTKRFEACRFLDSPETINVFLQEAMKTNDVYVLKQALREVSKTTRVQ